MVSDKLITIINSKYLVNSIMNSSHTYQTSKLEAFHSLIIHYAPKHTAFSYKGMQSRLQLAALNYNFNNERKQATTQDGKGRFNIQYPKYKKGGYIVRPIKTKSTHGVFICMYYYYYHYYADFVAKIAELVHKMAKENITLGVQTNIPPSLNSSYYKPNKDDAIIQHKTRFITYKK
jgi:hypothetical protein